MVHPRDCMYFPFTTAQRPRRFRAPTALLMAISGAWQMILVLVSDGAEARPHATPIPRALRSSTTHFPSAPRRSWVASQRIAAKIFFAGGAARWHPVWADRFSSTRPSAPGRRAESTAGTSSSALSRSKRPSDGLPAASRRPHGLGHRRSRPRLHGLDLLYVSDGSLFPPTLLRA